MTSSLGLSNIDSDNFNSRENIKKDLNFEERILKLYAQEIEDNQINEIIEGQLKNISVEISHRTTKDLIKKFNINQNKPVPPPKLSVTSKVFSRRMENRISEFESKVIPIKQNIAEETKDKSNLNQVKPTIPPRFHKNLGAIPKSSISNHNNEIVTNTKAKLIKKLHPDTEIKNLTLNTVGKSNVIFKTEPCTDRVSDIQIKETGQILSKISNTSLIPGMTNIKFPQTEWDDKSYMGLQNSSSALTPPSLPSRPPPVYKYTPDTFNKRDETMKQVLTTLEQSQNTQRKEYSTVIHSKEYVLNKGKGFLNASHKDAQKLCLPYTNQSSLHKDRESEIQHFSAVATEGETPRSLKLIDFSEKMNEINYPLTPEKCGGTRLNDLNLYENQNSILARDAVQAMKKPEIPKKPPKQAIQKRIEQILTKQLHNSGEMQTAKLNYEVTKEQNNIPSNNMRLDADSKDNFNNADFLKTNMTITNGRIAEITFFNRDKMKKIVGQNSSNENKGAINFERKFSTEDSTINQGTEGQKEKQRKTSEQNLSDLDSIFDSITRPELPQKLKTTQRSVSYSSLVQTFKDFSVALWNPYIDKDKRASIGDISIMNENKDIESRNLEPIIRNRHSVSSNEVDGVSCERRLSAIGQDAVNHFPWFHDVNISEANQRLLDLGQDGAFLIRPSSKPTVDTPYTASVMLSGKIFNIHIRHKANKQYAIGREKDGEKTFSSVSDMVKYHQDVPFEIRLSRNTTHNIYFRLTPSR